MTSADDPRINAAREFYAKVVAASGPKLQGDLEKAFAAVPRELFLGPGPWSAQVAANTYIRTPNDDPIHVYQDLLFALDADKNINNGQPSLHAHLLATLYPARGDTVLHIGCGTGYFSAVLAELVGHSGKVIAYEIEPELARHATENLKPWQNVQVRMTSGVGAALPRCDAIYVNAGATRPVGNWLDALNDGGGLVFPLAGSEQARRAGVNLAVTRHGQSFAAKTAGRSVFIPCDDATDADEGARVTVALETGQLWRTQSLVRSHMPDESALLVGDGWWLSSDAVA